LGGAGVLCPVCHGKGLVNHLPCPECGGMGAIHCCEGLVEQPEPFQPPEAAEAKPEEGPTPEGSPSAD
jgi:hypothetical protein